MQRLYRRGQLKRFSTVSYNAQTAPEQTKIKKKKVADEGKPKSIQHVLHKLLLITAWAVTTRIT